MVEVTTARGTYRYVYDALGGGRKNSTSVLTVNRTTGRHFMGRNAAGTGEQAGGNRQPVIYRDQGRYEPLARVDKAGKGARTGYCIFTRM